MKKRKEKRDDKLKTLSFASIYSHEKKKEESSVQSGNAWSYSLYLKVAVVIIGLIKRKVNKLILSLLLFEINTQIIIYTKEKTMLFCQLDINLFDDILVRMTVIFCHRYLRSIRLVYAYLHTSFV